jgi:hypothetical protein
MDGLISPPVDTTVGGLWSMVYGLWSAVCVFSAPALPQRYTGVLGQPLQKHVAAGEKNGAEKQVACSHIISHMYLV